MNRPIPEFTPDLKVEDAWEQEIYLSLKKRARLAWIIAIVSASVTFLLLICVALMLPLKEVKPIVITVDKYTGLANVESSLGTIELDDEEALTQALIYQYVRDLETYDPTDQVQRINDVHAKSKGLAAQRLQQTFTKENPLNPQTIYGANGRVSIKIDRITIIPQAPNTSQVEIQVTERLNSRVEPKVFNATVTLSFGFDRSTNMPLGERWKNPVGFYVDSYRIDRENL